MSYATVYSSVCSGGYKLNVHAVKDLDASDEGLDRVVQDTSAREQIHRNYLDFKVDKDVGELIGDLRWWRS